MVEIQMRYEGDLSCTAVHSPSGITLATDAPVDNHGRGTHYSPTDLVAAALGTCMLTTMGLVARDLGADIAGLRVRVRKHMTPAPPRRIATLEVEFTTREPLLAGLMPAQKGRLEEAALGCPVRISLLPAIEVPVRFDW